VRPGLVVVGAVIAALGCGLIATLFLLASAPAVTNQLSVRNLVVGSQSSYSQEITPVSSSSGSIGVTWSTTAPANVTLTPEAPCATSQGMCPTGPPALEWTQVTSGKGTDPSVNSSIYLLEVVNPGVVELKFSATLTLAYHPPSPLPTWGWGVIAGGALVLIAIGGVAVFLGLFLPPGVYQDHSADVPIRRTTDAPPEPPADESDQHPP